MTNGARAWLTPSLIIHMATTLVMLGGSWGIMSNRMEVVLDQNRRLETQMSEMRGDLRLLQVAQADDARAQERMAAMAARLESLERFQGDQVAYNTKFSAALARLER